VDQNPADPANTAAAAGVEQVYRLRVVLAGISPLIWRQLDQGEGLLDGEDASSVTLAGLGLRVSERFTYDYAFFSNLTSWRHDIWVQAIAAPRGRQPHPWCWGGSRGAPPEDCGGPEVFVALRQEHSAWQATVRLAELMRLLLDAPPGETVRSVLGQDALDELPELLYWARIDSFDKAAVNAALVTLCRKDTS
jgi:hypothetical protein